MKRKSPKNTSTPRSTRKNANRSQESSEKVKIPRMLKQLSTTFNFEEIKSAIEEKTVVTRSKARLKCLNSTDIDLPNIKNDTVDEILDTRSKQNEPPNLRRSGRIKIDKSSKPVYKYESVQDCFGNAIMVSKVIGFRSSQDSFSNFLQEVALRKDKKNKKNKILRRIAKRKANKTM